MKKKPTKYNPRIKNKIRQSEEDNRIGIVV